MKKCNSTISGCIYPPEIKKNFCSKQIENTCLILLMENNEDEIEFFGFLPIAFTTDLQESLEEAFSEIMQRNAPVHSRIQAQILNSLKKNIFIFNNFILRNILKFPANFRFERKNSDKVIHEDVNKLISLTTENQKRIIDLKAKRIRLLDRLHIEVNRNNGYKALLKNKEKYYGMADAAREIKKFIVETTEIYDNFRITACTKDNEFESLLEFKNIKNIYYKEEKGRLFETASVESLEYLCKKLNVNN